MANPVMNAQFYARITGIALAAVALLGIVLSAIGTDGQYGLFCSKDAKVTGSKDAMTCEGTAAESSFLGFDWTHNIIHVVLAAVALYVGFMSPANLQGLYAKVFGVVYALLGVVGFINNGTMLDALALHLETGENIIHLLIGGWGIVVGFFGTTSPTTPAPAMSATPTPTGTTGTKPGNPPRRN